MLEIGNKITRILRFASFLSDETIELLFKPAPLDDIGKVDIPDRILLKQWNLTPEEFQIMKTHTTLGRDAIMAAENHLNTPKSFLHLARETVDTAGCWCQASEDRT